MPKETAKKVLHLTEKENVQAVVIADNYNDNFSPITSSVATSLLPLVNQPLLDYTLNCLSSSGVNEVILFCSAFADQIKEFVRDRYWGRMKVIIVISEGCRTFGDAMRDLDGKSLIRGDFILLTGNVVGNLKLLSALAAHKKIQAVDKGATMTLIYKECGSRLKGPSDDFTLVTDAQTNKILAYYKNSLNKKKIDIPQEILLESADLDIRSDLFDVGICICSVSVPPLFSDNFDFQTKEDFLRGLLMNDEIMDNSVYTYYLPKGEYAAFASSWYKYHSISHDIMHRWTYPQVPDMRYEEMYSYKRQNVYLQEGVSLSQNCSITEDTVIGRGTEIGQKVEISSTVIGIGCKIHMGSVISNSHLFNDVTIEENCTIKYSVLAPGCVIHSRSTLIGCIVGPGVVVGEEQSIQNIRLQSVAGKLKKSFGSKAFTYLPSDESDSDSDSELGENRYQWLGLQIDPSKSDLDDAETTDTEEGLSERDSPVQEDTNLFYNEVVDSLVRGFEERISCENLVLEVNSSRYAYNVTVREVNYFVMRAILSLRKEEKWDSMGKILVYFLPLLKNYVRNFDAMSDCLFAIEDLAESESHILDFSVKLLHTLYNKDILSEEAILLWNDNPREMTPFAEQIRKQVQPFVKWLQEADEQSTSDDE